MSGRMRSVSVLAINLKPGDIIEGERIKAIHKFGKRSNYTFNTASSTGVLVVSPNPNGYDLRTRKFRGDRRVVVKRPKYNMAK